MPTSNFEELKQMVIRVADALGPELRQSMAFVGGVTTGLLITDDFTRQSVRATDDVDLITGALGYSQHAQLESELRERGFTEDAESDVICRKKLGSLSVDFMPSDDTLGFTNRWYKSALESAQPYALTPELTIRLLTPAHFIATKLEAWKGRGNGDVLSSNDLEDIFNLINGRDELIDELSESEPEMLQWIVNELRTLRDDEDFDYLLQSSGNGDRGRIEYLHQRVETILGLAR